jgi:hypothetical protein
MNISEQNISKVIASVDPTDESSINAAASQILEGNISAGSKVAVIDDPTYSYSGQKGKVKGPSSKGSGFVDVEFADGTVTPLMSNQLIEL